VISQRQPRVIGVSPYRSISRGNALLRSLYKSTSKASPIGKNKVKVNTMFGVIPVREGNQK
jgi:hypothetical protein